MYLLAKTLSRLLRLFPRGVVAAAGTFVGLVWFYLIPIRRRVAIDNVAASLTGGDRAAAAPIVRRSFGNLCRCTLAAIARGPDDVRGVEVTGEGPLKEALAAGKGAIVVTAHTGDWDLNELIGPAIGLTLHVPTRRVGIAGVQRYWEEVRAGRGNVYLAHNTPMTELLRILRTGGCLALVFDQNMPPKRGVPAAFFGRPASTVFAPAVLHFRTGAPIFPAFGARGPDGRYLAQIFPAIVPPARIGDLRADAAVVMTAVNGYLEEWIRRFPDQWLWAHRRWK